MNRTSDQREFVLIFIALLTVFTMISLLTGCSKENTTVNCVMINRGDSPAEYVVLNYEPKLGSTITHNGKPYLVVATNLTVQK